MASRVRLAPSLAHGLYRMALMLGAIGVISMATIEIAGPPAAPAPGQKKADQPYGPTFPFGLVQFFGQGAILAGGVYAARRWLKVRL